MMNIELTEIERPQLATVQTNMNYNTFVEAVDSLQVALDEAKAELLFGTVNTPAADHWSAQIFADGPIAYEQTKSWNFEISTIKGKATRKWFHISIYRTDGGLYEVNSYIL